MKKSKFQNKRSYKAGENFGLAIIEMIHLMYQRQTAIAFLQGLIKILRKEFWRRTHERK